MSTTTDLCAETKELALAAYEASGCKNHTAFCKLFGDAIGVRSFRYWIVGKRPAEPAARLILREFVAGWRPTCIR